MNKKKLSFIIIPIFIFLIIVLIHSIQINQKNNNKSLNSTIENNLEIVKNQTNVPIQEAQKEIDKKNKISSNIADDKNIGNQNFKEIFASSVFIGDSQMQGLQIYDILNSTSVLAKKGDNLKSNIATNLETLKNLSPSNIFIMYGMNDILIYENNISSFIADYKVLVTSIQNMLPSSNIFINCIMPVGESILEAKPIYKNIPKYNDALSDMCANNNIQFIDSSQILASNIDLLESDQMHFKPEFYKYWLNYLKIYIGE